MGNGRVSNGRPSRLFAEFQPVPTEEWERRIREELGRSDYEEQLSWILADDVRVRPFYRSEDLQRMAHLAGGEPTQRVTLRSTWTIQQNVSALKADATRVIREAIAGGVDRIGLDVSDGRGGLRVPDSFPLVLFQDVEPPTIDLHINGGVWSLVWLDAVHEAIARGGKPFRQVSAAFDPLSTFGRSGLFSIEWLDLAARAVADLPAQTRFLQAGADVAHDSGLDLVWETAVVLAGVAEYLDQLAGRGCKVEDVLGRLSVSVSVGSSFFPQIARLRALRLLIPQVISAFDADAVPTTVPILASTARRNMTLYDPHTNLLRATTEAASAVIGGCDVLVVRPFDDVGGTSSGLGLRLARNIHHLLRHESCLDAVNDPAAGSYYVEALTDALARAAWRRFQSIEKQGGLLEVLRAGRLQALAAAMQDEMLASVSKGERILVGTNRYPDPVESRADAAESLRDAESTPGSSVPDRVPGASSRWYPAEPDEDAPPFRPGRDAQELERLRQRTDRYAAEKGRPVADVIPVGSRPESMRRARSIADVLASAGIQIRVAESVETMNEAMSAAERCSSEILVIAAVDTESVPQVIHELGSAKSFRCIVVTGGAELDIEGVVAYREGEDRLPLLSYVQDRLEMGGGG